jgi:histidinol-phosphate aminotransferase
MIAGNSAWLAHVDKVRLPYNVNVLTQIVAEKVLQQHELLERQAAAIRAERTRLLDALGQIAGIEAFPSDANFILFRTSGAEQVFNGLRQRGILIKSLHGAHPALAGCLRVTVGTPEEDTRFLAALKETVNH